ncbi:MAG: hypothetical protein IKE31_10905 [Eubacterium sp.]|nr:hypothetical protein [Eubacterium sp.]
MHTVNGEQRIVLAFFDLDGVLSAPQYPVPSGEMSIGFTAQGWLAYCNKSGEDSYGLCRPLPAVRTFAASLKQEGAKLYVLSTIYSEYEPAAKRKFISTWYPDLFEDLLFVQKDLQKLSVIEKNAAEAGCSLQECALIEDTYTTLLAACERGITCVHLSNIFAGNISR